MTNRPIESLIEPKGPQLSWGRRSWTWYEHAPLSVRIIVPALTLAAAIGLWDRALTMSEQGEYAAAMFLAFGFGVVGVCSGLLVPRRSIRVGVIFLVVCITLYTSAIIWHAKGNRGWTTVLTTPTDPSPKVTPLISPTPDEVARARRQLHDESLRTLRRMGFRVRLNRKYSVEELGHFRIVCEVYSSNDGLPEDEDHPDLFMGCQSGAGFDKSHPFSRSDLYGDRCTVLHKTKELAFVAIPRLREIGFRSMGSTEQLVDEIEWKVDFHRQIPSYETLQDVDKTIFQIFVTDSLVNKISEITFEANDWQLISLRPHEFDIFDEAPTVPWFLPLSSTERTVQWKQVCLKVPESIDRIMPPSLKGGGCAYWKLEFDLANPKRLSGSEKHSL